MNSEICRICRIKTNLKYIEGENLLDKLKICANITINYEDCLPKYICQQCENALDFSYRLRKQSEETEKKLQEEQLQMEEEYLDEVEYELLHADNNDSNEIVEEMPVTNILSTLEQQDYHIESIFDDEKPTVEECDDGMIEVYLEEEEEIIKNEEEKEMWAENSFTGANMEAECIAFKMYSFGVNAKDKSSNSDVNVKKKIYTCATCQLELLSQTEYRQHIKQHEHQLFDCIQCTKSFPTHFRLKQHEQCHAVEVKMHQCTHCKKNFRIRYNLLRHIRVAHELQRAYACTLCTLTFGRADVLKNHLITHVKEKNFQCDKCSECFKSQRYLDSHLNTHINKQKKSAQQSRTKTHEKFKTSSGSGGNGDAISNEKLYYCPYCGKSSKHRFTHVNHMRTHTKERPYACKICSKKFCTMAAKLTHERIHSDLRPYQCGLCLSSFRQLSHLKEHRMIHDGIMPHTCNICNMSFTKKSNMSVHMRVHTGERPYKCADCGLEFSKLSILKRHEAKLHTSDSGGMQNVYVEENIIDEGEEEVRRLEKEDLPKQANDTNAMKRAVELLSVSELSDLCYEINTTTTPVGLIDNSDAIRVMKAI